MPRETIASMQAKLKYVTDTNIRISEDLRKCDETVKGLREGQSQREASLGVQLAQAYTEIKFLRALVKRQVQAMDPKTYPTQPEVHIGIDRGRNDSMDAMHFAGRPI